MDEALGPCPQTCEELGDAGGMAALQKAQSSLLSHKGEGTALMKVANVIIQQQNHMLAHFHGLTRLQVKQCPKSS